MIAASFFILAVALWALGMVLGWTEWQFIAVVAVVVGLMWAADHVLFGAKR